jgi:hypothetical protein
MTTKTKQKQNVEQLHMQLRATRAIPKLGLEPGASVHVTLASDGRVIMTRDDCQPEEVELYEVHMALTDGALVEVQRPALDDVVKLFEARFAVVTAGLKSEITQLKASTANLHKSGGASDDDN